MRKQVGKWKRAAVMVAFAGILSAPAIPAYAAVDKEPVSAESAEETKDAEAEKEKALIEAEKKLAASEKKQTPQMIQDVTIQTDPVDGWNDDKTQYYEGGSPVTNEIRQIDGKWYGFDDGGYLYKDQTFYLYWGGNYNEYRAKLDGTLFSNEWYDGEEEYDYDTEQFFTKRFYYQEGGAKPKDKLLTVDGVKYYFDYEGKIQRSFSKDMGTSVVFVNSDGRATEKQYPAKDDWISGTVNGRTINYYCQNNKLVKSKVIKIGTALYAFDYDGRMYSDDDFYFDGNYYRAKANGQLYVNAWYKGDSWSTYYYGEGGKAVKDVVTIGKKKYLFGSSGRLLKGSTSKVGNDWYVSDDNGVATKLGNKDGWKTFGDKKYYIKDGDLVQNTVLKIGKAYYGFNYNGQMYDNTTFSMSFYNGKEYEYYYYRAKKGGKLYVNEWFVQYYTFSDPERYYYGAQGRAPEGLKKVGKKQYCFGYSGRVMTDTVTYVKDVPYAIAKDGTVKRIQNNKWTTLDGHKYYAIKNKHLASTVQKIGSAYYGFDWNGRMYDNEVFSTSLYDDEGEWIGSAYYRAKVGGKLYVKQWFRTSYYGEGGVAPQGLTKIGKKLYYFEDGGEAVVNEYVSVDNACYHASAKGVLTKVKKNGLFVEDAARNKIVFLTKGKPVKNTWKTVKGAKYYFGADGYAIVESSVWVKNKQYAFNTDGTLIKNAWVDSHHYATKTGALAVGLTKIGKKKYFFDTDGNKMTGVVEQKKGTLILLGADGAYIGKAKANGWSTIKGTKYYAKKGVLAEGLTKIGNAYYYFESGKMCTDYLAWCYDSKTDKSVKYVFNSKGKRVNSGWFFMNNRSYYIDPKTHATLDSGYRKIGKKYYYISFDGFAEPVDYKDDDTDTLYTIGKNNVVTKKKKIANGRTLFAGEYWYYKDNMPYSGWVGKYFYVDGKMLRNTNTPDGYYVGNTGAVVKTVGWVMDKIDGVGYNTGRYIKKGGKLAKDEWLKIGGKTYYFDGYFRKTSTSKIKGAWCIFDFDGVLLKKLGATPKEGWVKAGGSSFFIRNGAPVMNKAINIGKKTYTFDTDGRLLKNTLSYVGSTYSGTATGLYVDKKGVAATKVKGWKKVNGAYFYFGKTGKAAYGWLTVSGKRYYVMTDSGRVTGYQVIDGKLYQFNKKGQLTKIFNSQNGWVKAGKNKYYFKDGYAYTGRIATISGKTYLFNYDGTLAKNEAVNGYYADKNGVIVRNTWKKVNGVKVYYGPTGYNLSGVHKIGKTIYYFN